jgi:hypothetical protein
MDEGLLPFVTDESCLPTELSDFPSRYLHLKAIHREFFAEHDDDEKEEEKEYETPNRNDNLPKKISDRRSKYAAHREKLLKSSKEPSTFSRQPDLFSPFFFLTCFLYFGSVGGFQAQLWCQSLGRVRIDLVRSNASIGSFDAEQGEKRSGIHQVDFLKG